MGSTLMGHEPALGRTAEMAVLDGKSVTFNGQQMTMENLSEIRQGRQEWERRLAALITRRRGHPGYRLARF